MHKEILEDIGEKELINRLGKFMPKNQISDDCALIKTKNENLLVNTDSLVENVHFNDVAICPQDVGWKAVVSNISDLLSSGSIKTLGITISLVLPTKTEWIWVEELYKGINKALKEYGGIILGGDCSKGNQKAIIITAFGIQGELKLRPAGFNSASYKKKKNCDEPSSTEVFEWDHPRVPSVAKGNVGVSV